MECMPSHLLRHSQLAHQLWERPLFLHWQMKYCMKLPHTSD
jgi:hypothetical protein